jgi:hypothetical protein
MTRIFGFIAISVVCLCGGLSFGVDDGLAGKAGPGPEKLNSGAGRFEFQRADKTVPVWYYLPENDEWTPYARKYGFILVAPEFSDAAFPGGNSYSVGGTTDGKGNPRPREQWSFSYIEPIFDAVKAATGNRSERYSLFGHSAGAQFVHRFLYFVPEARVAKAVAANAGWWTMPDPAFDFPYGLRGSAVDEAALKNMLQRPLVVLLGTADTDPEDVHLRRTAGALAEGPNRLARGQAFFEAGKRRAEALGVPLGWQLETAPGVAHSDSGMAAFAVKWLFGDKVGKAER